MTRLPGIGAATRFGVSRTVGLTTAVARAALPDDRRRESFRMQAADAITGLWDVTLEVVLRARLIERTADRLLAEQVVERVVLLALEHPASERLMSHLAGSPDFEQLVTRVVESPALERHLTRVVELPAFEQLVLSIARSEQFDRLLDVALASRRLDRVVTQIAESDEVALALRQQSQGMADEVTDEIRSRTIAADAMLERVARAIIRRRPAPTDGGPAAPGPLPGPGT